MFMRKKNPWKCLYQSRWVSLCCSNKPSLKIVTQKSQGLQALPVDFSCLFRVLLWLSTGSVPRCPHLGTWNVSCPAGKGKEIRRVTQAQWDAPAWKWLMSPLLSVNGSEGLSWPCLTPRPQVQAYHFPRRKRSGKTWLNCTSDTTVVFEDHPPFPYFPICSYKCHLLNLKFNRRAEWMQNQTPLSWL